MNASDCVFEAFFFLLMAMLRFLIIAGFFFFTASLNAQVYPDSVLRDTKYLEDQFYIGLSYNLLIEKPAQVSQRNLSYGLQMGVIKDIPINESRTTAFGIGVGYGVYSYYSNLRSLKTPTGFEYNIIMDIDSLKRNKVETHMLEIPLEFRWRNSNAIDYKFWRIYAGLKLGYVLGGRSKYVSENFKESFYNTDIRKLQYGLTFNFGYNTFNLHVYYALNTLFDDRTTVEGTDIPIKPLRIGLIFYIL